MATYIVLNLIFMAIVLLVLCIVPRRPPSRRWWLTLGALLIMTAVFDSLIIRFGIVNYNSAKLLGLYIGNVPIEDFFYTVLAVIIIPTLWNRMGKSNV